MIMIACIIFCLLTLKVDSTDIAAIYKHGIVMLKNADLTSDLSQGAENLQVELPFNLAYPIALAHDPLHGKFFVADANDKNTEIYSLSVTNQDATLESLITKFSRSTIEAMTYDPSNHLLIWADSDKQGIYFANISNPDLEFPDLITKRNVINPRGITWNNCDRILYWTERDERSPTIETYDMKKKSFQWLKLARNNTYYQAIYYNNLKHELIWAETEGDEEKNSSCKIVVKSLMSGEEQVLSTFQNCYPFSLTSDEDHIYWSDWGRHGIMRLSRENPTNSLVKLVDTPAIGTKEGLHNGAFGIVNLQDSLAQVTNPCPKRPIPDASAESSPVPPLGAEEFLPERPGFSPLEKVSLPPPDESTLHLSQIHRLRLIIIVLSAMVIFFMISTLLLVLRNLTPQQRFLNTVKKLFPASFSSASSPSAAKKTPRRFGPKVKQQDGQLCPRDADDGIKIDIEDCCQMTLCDTPCYTSVKKEGKSYKQHSKRGDKDWLLDEKEDA